MFGTLKAKTLAGILPFVLCTNLLCDSESQLQKAQDLLARGSLSQAETVLRQIVRDDPTSVDAHLSLGTVFALQGLRDQSLAEIETAIHLSPNSAKARNQLGVISSRFLETDVARKAFEDALSLDPNLAEAHVNLALILAQTGELPEAHEHLDRAIGLYGDAQPAARAYFLRAKVWSAQENNGNAILDLEKATALSPGDTDAWIDLSELRHSKGNLDEARAAAQKAVDLDPKNSHAQSLLGRLFLENGDAVQAVKPLEIAHSLGSDDKATLYSLARALRATGKTEEAKRLEAQVVQRQHLSDQSGKVLFAASGLNEEGLRLEHQGDIQGALEKYRNAVDMDPTGYGFRLNYALALCRLGRWQEAITHLNQVLKDDPDNGDAAKALFIAREEAAKKSK